MATLSDDVYQKAPEKFRHAFARYIEHGMPPGGFLIAVISNDLEGACGRGDDESRTMLFDLVSWLYNWAPSTCWGSEEKFQDWIEHHRKQREAASLGDVAAEVSR